MAAREVAIIIKAKDQASKVFEGVGSRLASIGKVAMVGAAVGVAALGAAITKFAVDAAPLADIEAGFHSLAETYDIDSERMLAAMGKASRGTVADIDLMRQANRALVGSGEELGQEFGKALPKLLEIARASAKLTGEDVGYLFESLVLGIKRSSPMIIDNTGLQIKLGEANEALALTLGKSVKELTSQERSIALLNATMEAGESMVASMGDTQLTAAEQMAVMRAELRQATFELGKAFLPVLTRVSKVFTGVITYVARKAIPIAEKFGKMLDRVFGLAAETIGGLAEAFDWLREGDYDAFVEKLYFTIEQAFGSRVAGYVADFADVVRGLTDAFAWLREGDIDGFLEKLWFTLEETFSPAVADLVTNFAETIVGAAGTIKSGFERIREGAVGLWQEHLYPRFMAIREGLQRWWEESGGAAGILATIRTGWQTRIVDPLVNFYEASGLKGRFDQIRVGISEWWDDLGKEEGTLGKIKAGWQRYIAGPLEGFWEDHLAGPFGTIREKIGAWWTEMGGVTGILGCIGAGWRRYIADPLSGFYSAHLAPGLHAISAGIRAWWAQQGGASGILTKIAAGWNKYIAMPLKGFWEAHLADKFDKLKVGIEEWAGKIWTFIETKVLVPIRDRLPKAVKDTTTEVKGVAAGIEELDKKPSIWERIGNAVRGLTDDLREQQALPVSERTGPLGYFTFMEDHLTAVVRLLKEVVLHFWTLALVSVAQIRKLVDRIVEWAQRTREVEKETMKLPSAFAVVDRAFDILNSKILGGLNSWTESIREGREEWEAFRTSLMQPIVMPAIQRSLIGPMPGYQRGGVVPGPLGQARLAVVHGGEEVIPARRRGGVTFDFRGAQFYGITQDFVEDLFKEHELIRELQGVRARNP